MTSDRQSKVSLRSASAIAAPPASRPGVLPAAILALLAASYLLAPAAMAGPNAGGVLICHDPGLFPTPLEDYCGEGIIPTSCQDSDPRIDETYYYLIWKVYAAFPEGSSPRLAGLVFGIDYDESLLYVLGGAPCGWFELPTEDWPESGSGTAVVWPEAQTGTVTEVYWFGGYSYYQQPTEFQLGPHPIQGGSFVDDSIPGILDSIAAYGSMGFYTDGYKPCPWPVPVDVSTWGKIKASMRP